MNPHLVHRIYYVMYAIFLVGLILFVAGCGQDPAQIEQKLLKPFATGYDSENGGIVGGMRFTGSLDSVSHTEMAIIADDAFSGKVVDTPQIEMTLVVEETGLIKKGELKITVQDRTENRNENSFVYKAECSDETGKLCGSFKKQKLNLMLYDGAGYIQFISDQSMKNKEVNGRVTIDGRGTELGRFFLKTEQSLDKMGSDAKEKTGEKKDSQKINKEEAL